MDFVLIDYQPGRIQINRDQTGTYGSYFHADGIIAKLLSKMKSSNICLPLVSFSYAAAILRANGHNVRIVKDLPEDAGGDVAIFATVMYNYLKDIEFITRYKKKFPRTKIGVIGGFSQSKPELYDKVCDFIICGEIEPPLYDFINGRWSFDGYYKTDSFFDVEKLPNS